MESEHKHHIKHKTREHQELYRKEGAQEHIRG